MVAILLDASLQPVKPVQPSALCFFGAMQLATKINCGSKNKHALDASATNTHLMLLQMQQLRHVDMHPVYFVVIANCLWCMSAAAGRWQLYNQPAPS